MMFHGCTTVCCACLDSCDRTALSYRSRSRSSFAPELKTTISRMMGCVLQVFAGGEWTRLCR